MLWVIFRSLNFLAILEAFAKHDHILEEHLLFGKGNSKMVSWSIQNDVITSIAQFGRDRMREHILSIQCYAVIADEVTDQHANKDILLICLRYLNVLHEATAVEETFVNSMKIERQTKFLKRRMRYDYGTRKRSNSAL